MENEKQSIYTIGQRLDLTVENLKYQGYAFFDDMIVLEQIMQLLKDGAHMSDSFTFTTHQSSFLIK